MRIVLTGGGTGGSVAPLLAIVEEIRSHQSNVEFLFVGTQDGYPEKSMVQPYDIHFKSILSGKFRRYWSFLNVLAPILVIIGFFQALVLLFSFRPKAVISAGGYVGVPCIWAAWVIGAKVLIHQPDAQPGLAAMMTQMFATKITVGYEDTLKFFPSGKAVWTGNPVSRTIVQARRNELRLRFGLAEDIPIVFVVGGGTGAKRLNELISEISHDMISQSYLFLITGKGKEISAQKGRRYYEFSHLSQKEMGEALSAADVVVSRAGANAIAEIAALGKASILVPLPRSPQEKNADMFQKRNAAIVFQQDILSSQGLLEAVRTLLADTKRRKSLEENMLQCIKRDAAVRIARIAASLSST